MGNVAEPKNEGQVTRQVSRQRNLAGVLVEVVDQIETRLASVVCEPEKPDTAQETPTLVSLAGQIEENNNNIESCITRLRGLSNRIEV